MKFCFSKTRIFFQLKFSRETCSETSADILKDSLKICNWTKNLIKTLILKTWQKLSTNIAIKTQFQVTSNMKPFEKLSTFTKKSFSETKWRQPKKKFIHKASYRPCHLKASASTLLFVTSNLTSTATSFPLKHSVRRTLTGVKKSSWQIFPAQLQSNAKKKKTRKRERKKHSLIGMPVR